jgi:hypothetical protein
MTDRILAVAAVDQTAQIIQLPPSGSSFGTLPIGQKSVPIRAGLTPVGAGGAEHAPWLRSDNEASMSHKRKLNLW